jgi:hypothetical protein
MGQITLERPLTLHQLPKVSSRLEAFCAGCTHNHSTGGKGRVSVPTAVQKPELPSQTSAYTTVSANGRQGCTKGDYRKGRLMKAPQKSLKDWTQQKWRTKSGKPSTQGPKATGERYLPEAAIKSLSSAEYAASTRAKRAGKAAGKQFVAQPKRIAQKTARHR